jgi:uroporphyrinogen decarboxylase
MEIPDLTYTQFDTYEHLPDVEVDLKIEQRDGVPYCRRTVTTPAGELTDTMCYPPAGKEYGILPDPEKREFLIKDEDDIEKIPYLLPDPSRFTYRGIDEIKREVGERTLLQMRPLKGVDHLLIDSMGLTNAMLAYYDNPEFLKRLLKLLADYYQKCTERVLDHKPDIVYDSWYSASLSAGWSPSIWVDLFLPHMKANRELVRQAGAFYHFYDDGKIMDVLTHLKELQPDIISPLCPPPLGDTDLEVVKRELGDSVCLNGHVDLEVILWGTPEEVKKLVREALAKAGSGGGYWLGTSDSIRNGSPIENVRAYFKAAREYGEYPLTF